MVVSAEDVRRISIVELERLYELEVLSEVERVELEDGVMVRLPGPSAEHELVVERLNRHFTKAADESWAVRVNSSFAFDGDDFTVYLPDLTVFVPRADRGVPRTALLVVEVAVSSQRRDAAKALRYARSGVAAYWIVDVPARAVLVHREPGVGGFAVREAVGPDALLEPPVGPPIAAAHLLLA